MSLADSILRLLGRERKLAAPVEAWSEMVHEPYSARLSLDWDPSSIRAAVVAADGGDLAPLSRLWSAVRRDGRIRGIMRTRTVGQVSLPYEFESSSAKARKFATRYFREAFPTTELARFLDWALGTGVAVAQFGGEWTESADGTPIPRLDVWDPQWLRYDYSDPAEPRWFLQTFEVGEVEITPGDGWIVFTPFGADKPWRDGLVNSLAVPWLLKQYALLDRAKHSEVHGSPAWVAKAPGLSEGQRQKLLRDLRRMAKDARVVLPEGVELELLESAGTSGSASMYSETIAWADEEYALTIAGQTVTATGTDGFSEGDIFERILSSFIAAAAEALGECLNAQALRPWAEFWLGPRVEAPRIAYQTRPRVQLQTQAAALQALGQGLVALDGALERHGLRVDVRKLLLEHDIPFEETPHQQAPAPSLAVVGEEFAA